MKRKIIKIDEEKCNGCGLCAEACHEGAIGMVNGKAKLLKDEYCDGLGDCLPVCPTAAITFEEREAAAYDEVMVKQRMGANSHNANQKDNLNNQRQTNSIEKAIVNSLGQTNSEAAKALPCGCPGTNSKRIERTASQTVIPSESETRGMSELTQWPVQIKLVPTGAPYFENANLLVAADCTAFAYADFHKDFIRKHVTLIGCPKLDMTDYSQKLAEIIRNNNIKSVKVVRMEVPCCGGIETAVKNALIMSGKMIPWQVVTVGINGELI